MPVRICLGLPGRPCRAYTRTGSRCPTCTTAHERARRKAAGYDLRYDAAWARQSRAARATHLTTHGPVCPGYQRPTHPVDPTDLVVDHDLGVLCRACNGTKAATEDKERHRAQHP